MSDVKYGNVELVNILDELLGKSFVKVENNDDEELIFTAKNGDRYIFYHVQDCCECVTIEDICGELSCLENYPLFMAEETIHENIVDEEKDYSTTYTFYKFATDKGYVTVRWCGSSNGYYSESVDFKIEKARNRQ